MKVLITGADGFVGKNLQLRLAELPNTTVICFGRKNDPSELPSLIQQADFIFHLAGSNRPTDEREFDLVNVGLTCAVVEAVSALAESTGKKVPIAFASSAQATLNNSYGKSKRRAEDVLRAISISHEIPVAIFRLPNVFGKWCKPNYNSVVATFCYNVARDLDIRVHDAGFSINLVYIDDVVDRFIKVLNDPFSHVDSQCFVSVFPEYSITVGELAEIIRSFRNSRETLLISRVGIGLERALYSTYVSYLPTDRFSYSVPMYADSRGSFVEMVKTPDCGQVSFFTARPGVTRGGHYHHSKTEKFLVVKGAARFKFRNLSTDEGYELVTSGDRPEIVETVPGWTHDITNVGTDEMFVMLWANEVFDRDRPDTFACPL